MKKCPPLMLLSILAALLIAGSPGANTGLESVADVAPSSALFDDWEDQFTAEPPAPPEPGSWTPCHYSPNGPLAKISWFFDNTLYWARAPQDWSADQLIATIEEAAEYAGVDVETIEDWLKNGLLKTGNGSFVRMNLDIYQINNGQPSDEDKKKQVESEAELIKQLEEQNGLGGGQGDRHPRRSIPSGRRDPDRIRRNREAADRSIETVGHGQCTIASHIQNPGE